MYMGLFRNVLRIPVPTMANSFMSLLTYWLFRFIVKIDKFVFSDLLCRVCSFILLYSFNVLSSFIFNQSFSFVLRVLVLFIFFFSLLPYGSFSIICRFFFLHFLSALISGEAYFRSVSRSWAPSSSSMPASSSGAKQRSRHGRA